MGSLNNLYISQSFQSLVHFGTDWTASANLIQLQDGLGNNLGVSLNTDGDITAVGDITASNLYAPIISGSKGHFTDDLFVSGTIHAFEFDVTILSSSIIFTSGSNIIGDEANVDTQTLVGRVIVTGSLEVTGSSRFNGNVTTPNLATTASNNFIGKEQITGSLEVSGGLTLNGSSSFTELTGSLAEFSQSIDARILSAQGILQLQSQSVTLGLARTLNFSGADVSISIANQTGSVFVRTTQFATTGSNTFVGSNTFTQFLTASVSGAVFGLGDTVLYSQSVDDRLDTIVATGATTGSNTFVGNQIITGSLILSSSAAVELSVIGNQVITGSLEVTGSMVYSGSVRGVVIPLTITSQTASIDCSIGNFFTLTLPSGSNTFINASNINPGQTISLKIKQPSASFGTVTFNSSFKFPINFPYLVTPLSNAEDIISMVSYDTTSLYANAVNTLT
jgi:hypothetical protein